MGIRLKRDASIHFKEEWDASHMFVRLFPSV